MIKVEVKPELLSWARERAGFDIDGLTRRFPKLAAWEQGTAQPTLKQIEKFASATHTPIGFLFLQEPPVETIPIPDFRTVRNKRIARPSPDLLDMIYVCQQRQEWYRDFARSEREASLSFVGSASLNSNVEATAASMRRAQVRPAMPVSMPQSGRKRRVLRSGISTISIQSKLTRRLRRSSA